MASLVRARRTLLGRDVAVAYAVIIALYLVRTVEFRALQIPAYLLIVAYDVVEVVLPFLTPYYPLGFPLFLYLLALVGAGVARRLQSGDGSTVIRTVGGVCLIVGTISLLFGASIGGPLVTPGDNPTPLVITATTGGVLLITGWWLLGRPLRGARPSRRE
ncbi:hypothetical protein [Halalkalicoccus sp. NIPERK01]|uniref:hypothetical protein n=1 Tax=Halalkalicoccus sp. NIPERK01 TaxID=3053469 RepID=UPI00256EF736|nr:hypothetical protein [Halalkalicoccus sp. NIPERK01]MDL5362464.1 hypothetical protein [Halalkalicoccus sp. NIPERK01]